MRPDQIASSNSEHGHQAALFAWCAFAHVHGIECADEWAKTGKTFPYYEGKVTVPELKWFHAIPNGANYGDDAKGARITGGRMKAEGLRKGVSDTFLPVRRGAYSGLYIEMKRPSERPKSDKSKGGVSDEQREFGNFVLTQGFGFVVCYTWVEAVEVLKQYLNWR